MNSLIIEADVQRHLTLHHIIDIWDLADPNGLGFLDKQSFFVALKLVALAQNNKDILVSNLALDLPPPVMGDSTSQLASGGEMDWTMKPNERAKYDKLFESLGPIQGALPSSKVKPVMMNSKLPVDVLGRVWDLSDIDRDGSLDRDEFALAMHLIYKALDNHPVPSVLPRDLIPQTKVKKILPGAVPVLPTIPVMDGPIIPQIPSPPLPALLATIDLSSQTIQKKPSIKWIISSTDQLKYDSMFESADLDRDGFVNGVEIKDIFLQSGLPQPVLAHIWNLCDIKQNGRLNSEQFALAMYLVQQRVQGIEPPATLSPEMIPPSFRPKSELEGPPVENGGSGVTGNSELDLITKDIEELTKEKQQLEHDITQKEADIRIKNGEIKLLSGELTTLSATLKQLENQKGEAQKRLDDLDSQRTDLDRNLDELKKQLDEELEKVNNLKKHLHDQEASLKSQEDEVVTKKQELNDLKIEESKLEHSIQAGKSQFDILNKNLQDTLLQISQTKAKITQLQEYNRQLSDATTLYDSAIANSDASSVSDTTFKLQPMFMDPEYSNLSTTNASSVSGFSVASSGFEDDPFKDKDPFTETNGFTTDPFAGYDPFKEDPFKAANGNDPFGKPFATTQNDPFKDTDPFGGAFQLGKSEPDPFGGDAFSNRPSSTVSNGDLFESDPFGPPPVAPRTESPTPVLPPKKSKQPPPRPAPPRSAGTKTRAAPPAPSPDPFADVNGGGAHRGSLSGAISNQADPFASAFGNDPFEPFGTSSVVAEKDPFSAGASAAGADSFANFADFDNKFSQHVLSEEEQLAWAKQESVRLERDRQKRAAEREQAELDLALALSKAEAARRA